VFIKLGDKPVINTDKGTYVSRASQKTVPCYKSRAFSYFLEYKISIKANNKAKNRVRKELLFFWK